MNLRIVAAAVFCCSMFAAMPALQASADSAYLFITKAGANPTTAWEPISSTPINLSAGAVPATPAAKPGVAVAHAYKLEDFAVTQTTAPQTGNSIPGLTVGTTGAIAFKATTPSDGSSSQLLTLTSVVPEIRIQIEGTAAADAFLFTNCQKTSGEKTTSTAGAAGRVMLLFACASSTYVNSIAGQKTGSSGVTAAPAVRARNLNAYIVVGGSPVLLTSFAADPATQSGGQQAGYDAGSASPGTLQFSLPLDGSGKAIAGLAGTGTQSAPLTISLVRPGEPIGNALLVEQFLGWSVEKMMTSFNQSKAATDYLIKYTSLTRVSAAGWSQTKNTPALSPTMKP